MSLQIFLGYSVTVLSMIVAIITTYVSFKSLKIANKNTAATMATVDLFKQELEDNTVAKNMEFHYNIVEMFRNLQLQFPAKIGEPDFVPSDEDERLIFVFWFLIFDEWFACNHEGKYLQSFWEKYYLHELRSVMKRPVFVNVLKKMVEEKQVVFFGLSESFSQMLNDTYQEVNGVHLFERFKQQA